MIRCQDPPCFWCDEPADEPPHPEAVIPRRRRGAPVERDGASFHPECAEAFDRSMDVRVRPKGPARTKCAPLQLALLGGGS